MNEYRILANVWFATALVLPTATAQTQFSRGPLAFTPGAFSFDLTARHNSQIRTKRPGFKKPLLDFSAPANRPQYDKAADFSRLTGRCQPTGPLDIDAMSVGLDWVLAADDGTVDIKPQRWGMVAFTLRRGSKGRPGSTVAQEAERSADLFSHILEGSSLDSGPGRRPGPAGMIGRTMRALDRSELAPKTPTADMDAVDLHMNNYRMPDAIANGIAAWTGHPPRFYFSVSCATAKHIPIGWTPDKSGATIFFREWRAATQTWTCPRVFRSFLDLGVGKDFDVLALAIDDRQDKMLLSIVDARKRTFKNPLLFHNFAQTFGGAPVVPYGGPAPVSKKLDLIDTDTINGVCGLDPTFTDTQFGRHPIAYTMATPMPHTLAWLLPKTGSASGSAFLDFPCQNNNPSVKFFLTGWQPSGPKDGTAFWFLRVNNFESQLFSFPRKVDKLCPGSPVQRTLCIFGMPPGAQYSMHWAMMGQPILSDVAEAFPLGMLWPN